MTADAAERQQEEVASTLERGVWHVRLKRPAKRNALTMPMFRALAESLNLAQGSPSVQAVLLSGEGASFCAGHDLASFDAWPQAQSDPVPQFLHALASLRKPLVAAVHGGVAGIGVTLLLHADWVVCSPEAKLRLPFADLGIGPEAASSLLLAQAVGSTRAKRLLLGGEPFSGVQAHDWGLVTELGADDEVAAIAMRRAEQLGSQRVLAGALKQWQVPEAALHERIDEEIQFINSRLAHRASSAPQIKKAGS